MKGDARSIVERIADAVAYAAIAAFIAFACYRIIIGGCAQ